MNRNYELWIIHMNYEKELCIWIINMNYECEYEYFGERGGEQERTGEGRSEQGRADEY